VHRLNGVFGSHDITTTPSGAENNIVPFNPTPVVIKVVTTITYLDVHALDHTGSTTRRCRGAYDTTTTDPAIFVNVSAQGDSDSIGCQPAP
jgi:Mycobacterium membrane protein